MKAAPEGVAERAGRREKSGRLTARDGHAERPSSDGAESGRMARPRDLSPHPKSIGGRRSLMPAVSSPVSPHAAGARVPKPFGVLIFVQVPAGTSFQALP